MEMVITIGRQFGSGGAEIGKKLAEYYGIGFYDKEVLSKAAKDSGFCEEMIKNHESRPVTSFLYNLVMDTYSFGYGTATLSDMPINHQVFLAQFEAINKIASEGACVIVGRCADYALDKMKNCVKVFISSDMDKRLVRVMKTHGVNAAKAGEMITRHDKQRQTYYNYYTSKKWGNVESYDIAVNSGALGIDQTVELLKKYIEVRTLSR